MFIIKRKIPLCTSRRLMKYSLNINYVIFYKLQKDILICNFLPKYFFTLSVELAAESLALFLGLEFVSITTAAAVNERLTHLMLRIVIIRGDGLVYPGDRVVAIARIDRCQADRALWFFDRRYCRDLSNFR